LAACPLHGLRLVTVPVNCGFCGFL
jgi:hypothetical protein